MPRLANFWSNLTRPHPKISDEIERINSRLLAILIIVVIPIIIILLSIFGNQGPTPGTFNPDLILFGTFPIALIIVFIFNYRGYYKFSVLLMLVFSALIIIFEAVLDNDLADMVYLILPLLGSIIFLPRSYMLFLSVLFIGLVIAAPIIIPQLELIESIRVVLPMIVLSSLLIFVYHTNRDAIEVLRAKKVKDSELRYTLVTEAVNDGIWDWDIKTNKVFYSPRWLAIIGHDPKELGDSPEEWRSRIHPDDLERVTLEMEQLFNNHKSTFQTDHRFRHKSGKYLWVMSRGRVLRDEQGGFARIVGSHTDITLRKQAEKELEHNALHDSLTGLANRYLFNEKVNHSIMYARKNPAFRFAVLFLDLDNFKDVNDSLGHEAGDQVLKLVAKNLRSNLFDLDTVARMGGDEFVVLLEGLDDFQRPVDIVNRLNRSFEKPFLINNTEIVITASIGIVVGTVEYRTAEDVLRDADIAMYHAKKAGRNTFEIFNPTMREEILARLDLEREVRQAIQNQEFQLAYQPIINLNSSQIIGFEALLRWNHPTRGIIPPGEFIPIAEQTGLIIPLGEWVLQTACQQLADWNRKYGLMDQFTISVNISEKQIAQSNFYIEVERILQDTGIAPSNLSLEITENAILQSSPEVLTVMKNLDDMGINLQLDDFGAGQSSISYLRQFPVRTIKIDRSFIRRLEETEDRELVQGVIQLAQALKLRTIAEGIETRDQAATLLSLQCDQGQGFGISIPRFAPEIENSFFDRWKSTRFNLPVTDFQG